MDTNIEISIFRHYQNLLRIFLIIHVHILNMHNRDAQKKNKSILPKIRALAMGMCSCEGLLENNFQPRMEHYPVTRRKHQHLIQPDE